MRANSMTVRELLTPAVLLILFVLLIIGISIDSHFLIAVSGFSIVAFSSFCVEKNKDEKKIRRKQLKILIGSEVRFKFKHEYKTGTLTKVGTEYAYISNDCYRYRVSFNCIVD